MIDTEEKIMQPLDCPLGMGDKTASMGWLRRSNFRENDEHDSEWLANQKLARKLAELVLYSNTTVCRQWLEGLTTLLQTAYHVMLIIYLTQHMKKNQKLTAPTLLPENYKIRLFPQKISFFVTSILQILPVKQQRLLLQKPIEPALSNVGALFCLTS